MGSLQRMQGEISHWWPLTDGGLAARRNTNPPEYLVSPHYTLHRLSQLPVLAPLTAAARTHKTHVSRMLLTHTASETV